MMERGLLFSRPGWFLGMALSLVLLPALAGAVREERAAGSQNKAPFTRQPVMARAVTPPQQAQQALADLAAEAKCRIEWDDGLGVPRSVRGVDLGQRGAFSRGKGLAVSGRGLYERDAVAVLDGLAGLFRMVDAEQEFRAQRVQADRLGFHHVRLQQMVGGVKVQGGEIIVHFDKGNRAYEVNGRYVPDLQVSLTPALTATAAVARAQANLSAQGLPAGTVSGTPERVVFTRRGPARLAYAVTLVYRDERAGPGRWRYWVDAQTGVILDSYNDIPHIPAPTTSGTHTTITGTRLAGEDGAATNLPGWHDTLNSCYYLYNTNRRWLVENVASSGYPDANTYAYRATNDWGVSDPTEISAALNFHLTQSYYVQRHGLFSFDNAGLMAYANVHEGTRYVNAYWDGSEFYIGDGDGVTANSLATLDICSHEFTHAVTEYSAGLAYSYESGALNESFSDVLGSCVEFFGQADDRASYPLGHAGLADWLLGEDSWLASTALRDMRNPANPATVGAGNEQPTRYRGTYWYAGSGDNGGVHQNSGVQNFFFYLSCEGGSGTNDGLAYGVTGIGITNAEQVAYRALTVYCTVDTDYRAARSAWLSAAEDLNAAWVPTIRAAWDAVGVSAFSIAPETGASFTGNQGGPFAPASAVYTLQNSDSVPVGWGALTTQAWVTVTPAGGAIPAFGSQAVTVSVNTAANGLPIGTHGDTIRFTNSATASADSRPVSLLILPPTLFSFSLDSDPGWTTQGEWEFGVPAGSGGDWFGSPDPTAGASGANVYGVNLNGDYSTTPGGPYYLTAGPFDFSAYTKVSLVFQRWLNTDFPPFVDTTIEASSNGTTWVPVWTNSMGNEVVEDAWTLIHHDLSAFADRQSSFYVRWGYRVNGSVVDPAFPYSGWNIDDIDFHAQALDDLRLTPETGLSSSGYQGGPFTPSALSYALVNAGTNGPISWTASSSAAWVTVTPAGGMLAIGAGATSVVAFAGAVASFAPGQYTATVFYSNTVSGFVLAKPVQLTVQEPLGVTPAGGLASRGYQGGPFTPSAITYGLSNSAIQSLVWTARVDAAWLSVQPSSGLLAAGASTTATVTLAASAYSLTTGVFQATIAFSNAASGSVITRPITLTVFTSPQIVVSPPSLTVTNLLGGSQARTLQVANGAAADAALTFTVRTRNLGSTIFPAFAGQPFVAPPPPPRDFTHPVAGHDFVPGQLLVRFAAGIGAADRDAALASLGGATIKRTSRLVAGLTVVNLPRGMSVEKALPAFNATAGIVYAEPNYLQHALDTLPNDTRFGELWGLHNTGQNGGVVDADIDAPAAWDLETGNSNIIVAVIDTGIDYTHPDLAPNMWRNPGEIPGNLLDDDGNGYIDDVYGINAILMDGDPMDDHYHGTHTAGTVGAAGNNSNGVVGVCWRVRLMAVKFLDASGSGYTDDAITCIEYATLMGARVLNNSWGGEGYSQALKDAIDAAGAAEVVFAAAAGNDGMDNDTTASYPSGYACSNIIAVMSVDNDDGRSSFSNYGQQSVDLAAPGGSILSCQPGGGYQLMSGTSMATPHVAGACALLLSVNPGLTAAAIKEALMSTVDPTLPGQCVSGGRMNLAQAVSDLGAAWLVVTPLGGTNLAPGAATNLTVSFLAAGLNPGVYSGEVVITCNDVTNPVVHVPVAMTVLPDDLLVQPPGDLVSAGDTGGPFVPSSTAYTVSNFAYAAGSLTWTAAASQPWVTISPDGGTLAPGARTNASVMINALAAALPDGGHQATVSFSNVTTGAQQVRTVTLTVGTSDYFTELFSAGDNDLGHMSLTFTPNGSARFYDVCRTPNVTAFPTDPTGGTSLSLPDDDYAQVTLTGGMRVSLYGQATNSLFVGSNGYLTFGTGDFDWSESLADHFDLPRIAALFDDLYPPNGGTISWKQTPDRLAVTFDGVPEINMDSNTNSFQFELFTNGTIRITWLGIAISDGLAGLSRGVGLPDDFVESDLTAYPSCGEPPATVQILASSTAHGSISPSGVVSVAYGGATNFVIGASTYYHIGEVLTNGAPIDHSFGPAETNLHVFWWSNLTANGAIHAQFAEDMATNDTPVWWLAGYGLTNGDFNAEALADQDGDRALTWQEFVADTSPTNVASVLLMRMRQGGAPVIVEWPSSTQRLYQLQTNTVVTGVWWNAAGMPEQPGSGGFMAYTNDSTARRFLRVKVRRENP